MKALTVKDLSVNYHQQTALKSVSLAIPQGVRAAIIGPNGAGKSTFLKACLHLIPSQSGNIQFFDNDFHHFRHYLAYVPQSAQINWQFPATVEDVILMGIASKRFGFQPIRKDQRQKASQALEAMQLADLRHRPINQLSGGQKQRVFLARAIAQNAQLYLLDEPLAGVDATSEQIIMDQLKLFQEQGKTSITVHHDLSTVEAYFDYVILLNQSLVAAGYFKDVFTDMNLQKAYRLPILTQKTADKPEVKGVAIHGTL